MLKSFVSKLVAVSASAMLASAIIASSASALNIRNTTVRGCEFDSPQITLTSAGQVQGTGFCPSTEAVVDFDYSASAPSQSSGWGQATDYPIVSANGTFTVPLAYSRPVGYAPVEGVSITAHDDAAAGWDEDGGWPSNTITVTVTIPAAVF